MSKFRKCFVWFYMLSKRLLKQWSFIILLCLIPVIMPLTNLAMSQDSGIVSIVLCNEYNDPTARNLIDSLMENDGVILFSTADTREKAKKCVANHKADAAWVFSSDFSEKLDDFASNRDDEPVVEIIERESTIPLRVAREKLFGTIYSDFSYSIYKNFIYSNLVTEDELPQQKAREYYDELPRGDDIIKIEKLHDTSAPKSEITYLTAPIRGILSLIVMLCTLTAAMYFLKDQLSGKFDWLPKRKRIAPAFGSCFSASLLSSIAVFIAIQLSSISTGFTNEILPAVLYVFSATGFCMVLCMIFRSPGKLGALIPGIIIIMLALSPIFFNFKVLQPVRLMMPTYYYIHSIYNTKYYLYSLIYCGVTYSIVFLLNYFLPNKKSDSSIV